MAVTYANKTKLIKKLFTEVKDDYGRVTLREMGFHLVYYQDDTKAGVPVLGPYVEPNSFMDFNGTSQFPGEGGPISEIAIMGTETIKNGLGGGVYNFWKHPFI